MVKEGDKGHWAALGKCIGTSLLCHLIGATQHGQNRPSREHLVGIVGVSVRINLLF